MKPGTPLTHPTSTKIEVADTNSMRQFLIAGMRDVMTGQITTWQAKAACNFAQQIYNVTALEVKVMLAQEKLNGQQIKTVSFVGANPAAAQQLPTPSATLGVAKPNVGSIRKRLQAVSGATSRAR